MPTAVSEREYANFGRCIFLSNGMITVGVTKEVGPRIICFSLDRRSNVLFEDTDRSFSETVEGFGVWYTYGGHRLWCAPETKPETYFPDNSPVSFRTDGGSCIFTARPTDFGKEYSLELTLSDDAPELSITQRIKNISNRTCELAPWSVTGLRPGGVCVVPMSRRESGFLPNRVLSLWDYSDLGDSRFRLTNSEARIRQDKFVKKAFKAGFNVEDGFTAYAVEGQLFVKSFGGYEDVRYPDYSCNVEVYTNELFLECELLGGLRSYAPGETAELREKWSIFDNSSDREPEIEHIKELLAQ